MHALAVALFLLDVSPTLRVILPKWNACASDLIELVNASEFCDVAGWRRGSPWLGAERFR